MNISVRQKWSGREPVVCTVAEHAESVLNSSSFESGELEMIQEARQKHGWAIARLLDTLVSRNLLTLGEALNIIADHGHEVSKP